MSIGDKIFDLAKASFTLTDKVDSLSDKVNRMDDDLRNVDRRLTRMETTVEIYTAGVSASRRLEQDR